MNLLIHTPYFSYTGEVGNMEEYNILLFEYKNVFIKIIFYGIADQQK